MCCNILQRSFASSDCTFFICFLYVLLAGLVWRSDLENCFEGRGLDVPHAQKDQTLAEDIEMKKICEGLLASAPAQSCIRSSHWAAYDSILLPNQEKQHFQLLMLLVVWLVDV